MTAPDRPAPDRPPDGPDVEQLQDYLDGRLSPDAAREVERLLDTHSAWRDELEILRQLGDVVRGAMPDASQTVAPDDFVAQVRGRIEHEKRAGDRTAALRSRWGRILAFSYAAAALVVAGFTVAWMVGDDNRTTPTQTAVEPLVKQVAKPLDTAKTLEGAGKQGLLDKESGFSKKGPAGGLVTGGGKAGRARGDWSEDKSAPNETTSEKNDLDGAQRRSEGRKRGAGRLGGFAPGSIEGKAKDPGAKDRVTLGAGAGGGGLEEKARVDELDPPKKSAPKKKSGPFAAPGGALPPNQRKPSDERTPRAGTPRTGAPRTSPPPTRTAAPGNTPTAGLRKGQVAPQYVLSLRAADVPQAQAKLKELLALVKAKPSLREAATDAGIQARVKALRLTFVTTPRLAHLEEAAKSAPAREQADADVQDSKSEESETEKAEARDARQGGESDADAGVNADDAAKTPATGGRARRGRNKAKAPAATPKAPAAPGSNAPSDAPGAAAGPPKPAKGMTQPSAQSFDLQMDLEVLQRLLVTSGQPATFASSATQPQSVAGRPTPARVPVRIILGR